jgi:hypothetical protein
MLRVQIPSTLPGIAVSGSVALYSEIAIAGVHHVETRRPQKSIR